MSDFFEAPQATTKIKLGGQDIVIDNKRMSFNESNLSVFMENLALWYDYFCQKLSEAEALLAFKEHEYEIAYATEYEKHKTDGCTDKLSEANAKKSEEVSEHKKEIISAKHKVTLLKQHLRSWDKAHENAQSRGHTIRKEMDKLNSDIMIKKDIYNEVDEVVRKNG